MTTGVKSARKARYDACLKMKHNALSNAPRASVVAPPPRNWRRGRLFVLLLMNFIVSTCGLGGFSS